MDKPAAYENDSYIVISQIGTVNHRCVGVQRIYNISYIETFLESRVRSQRREGLDVGGAKLELGAG